MTERAFGMRANAWNAVVSAATPALAMIGLGRHGRKHAAAPGARRHPGHWLRRGGGAGAALSGEPRVQLAATLAQAVAASHPAGGVDHAARR